MHSKTVIESTRRLRKLSQEIGLTRAVTIDYLLDFYELKTIDILIQQIRAQQKEGFTAQQLSQMSVLLTQLSLILQDYI